jgi:HK97 family phage major capsid protein
MDKFKEQLSKLPFLTAMILAVAGMPLDVFAYNQRGIGHAHSAPWLSRAGSSLARAIVAPFAWLLSALRSPQMWRIALAATALVLAIHSPHAHASGLVVGLTVPELLQKKGELANEAKEVLAAMGDSPRAEDEAKFEAIHVDIEKITKKVERMLKQEEVEKGLNDSAGRKTDPGQPGSETRGGGRITSPNTAASRDLLNGMRAWFLAGKGGYIDQGRTRGFTEAAGRAGINLNSKELTLKFPSQPLRPTQPGMVGLRASRDDIADWEQRNSEHAAYETRAAMGTTSGAVGGYTVPNEMMRPLEVALLAYGGVRQAATVIRTDSGASLPLPTSNDSSNKGAILTENTGASEVDITFSQLTLDAYKYSSKYLLISVELLQDSAVNVSEWIGKALGIRIGRITNDHFTTGTGSSQPNGAVTAATLGKTAAAVATVTYDELVDLVHSVDPAYRDNGRFMFHDGGLKMLKKIKVLQYSGDTTGIPLWSPGLSPGQPDSILGYPYIVNQSMTTPATGVKSILFGDFSKYIVRDVRDITLLRLDERFAELHQVAYLAFSRHDGDLLDAGTHPVSYLVQA